MNNHHFKADRPNFVVAMLGSRYDDEGGNYLRCLPTPKVYRSESEAEWAAKKLSATYNREFVILQAVGMTRSVPQPRFEAVTLPVTKED
jgi:hypothetical protein